MGNDRGPEATHGNRWETHGSRRLDRLIPFGLVALGPLLLFGPMLVRGDVLYWGTPLLQFVPWRTYAFHLLRLGFLPLWNAQLGMGAPLLANYQSALLYPPNWFLALTTAGWGEGLLVLFHLVFAGAGMVLLLRRLRIGPLGQAVGGIAFASCSYLVSRAGFFSLNATASWLPWTVLAADMAAEASRSGPSRLRLAAVAALGGVIGLQALAGHAQSLTYSLLLALAWSLWRSIDRGGWRDVGRLGLLWLAGGALGIGLAAVQLLPTAEYLLNSSRESGLQEAAALTYSFWPWRSLGLILPGLFGSPAYGDYWGYGNFWEDALYIGVLPLLLAILASLRAGRLGRRAGQLRTFLLIVAGVSFVLALGANTPIFPFLFRAIPLFGVFNAPTRINLITAFCLAILAGLGAELWARPTGRSLYWTRLGTAGAGAVMVLGLAAWLAPTGIHPSFGRAFAWAGLFLLLAGGLALVWPEHPGRRWLVAAAVLITLDLVVAGWGLNPSASASLYQGETPLASKVGKTHRIYLLPEPERILKFQRTHRFDSFQQALDPWLVRQSGLPNTTLLDSIPSGNNFDPLLPQRYVDWIVTLAAMPAEGQERMLQMMDVGWVGRDVGQVPPWVTYQAVPEARRARVVPEAVTVDSRTAALERLASAGIDFDRQVILEAPAAVSEKRGGPGQVEIVPSTDPNRVAMRVVAPEGGWLLLSDTWYPGWHVRIGSAPAESFPADVAFRAVWVPPGTSTATWEYRPSSLRTGEIVSVISLVVLLGIIGLWTVRRRSA